LVKSYNEKIVTNPDVDMVHIALEDKSPALEWAKKESFPWPHIMEKDMGRFLGKYFKNVAPTYVLIDRDGTVLANGKAAIFAKIAELAPEA
jgi:hypothetical protein